MKNRVTFGLAYVLLAMAVLALYGRTLLSREKATPPKRGLSATIGDWTGQDLPYDPEVLGVLEADQIVYRSYKRSGQPPITLFVALYDSLEKTDFSHSPVVCFTGQGWRIEKAAKREIHMDGVQNHAITVNQLVQNKTGTTMIAFFWYQCGKGAMSNRGLMKLSLLVDRLLGSPDRNAFVRVTTVVPERMLPEETAASLVDFVRDLYPPLRRFVAALE